MKRHLILLVSVFLAACTVKPETMTPVLEPTVGGPIWPLPPEIARYGYAGTLIGERDFLVPKENTSTSKNLLAWVVGIVFGDPKYLELKRPVSGMVDAAGRVLVVDAGHKAVLVFDMAAQKLLTWHQAAKGLSFTTPVAICDDGAGGFLVTDSELGEVFRLNGAGTPIGRFGRGILKRPTGIARNDRDGRIYVTDTVAHDLKVFDAQGTLIDTLGGRGNEPGMFNTPTHLAFSGGALYVADTLNFRIQVFDAFDDAKLSFGKIGANVGNMTRPKGVAVAQDGRIYAVESYFDHLLIFNDKGQLLLPIGGTGQGPGQFYLPSGVWTHGDKVYVADMFNGRIVVFKELTGSE